MDGLSSASGEVGATKALDESISESRSDCTYCAHLLDFVRGRLTGLNNRLVDSSPFLFDNTGGETLETGDPSKEAGQGELERSLYARFFSRMGKPQPHFLHFCPMCCSQMPRHSVSSSASIFQRRATWAAR